MIDEFIKAVAIRTHTTPNNILGKCRHQKACTAPRHLAMYILRSETGYSLRRIAWFFNRNCHSSVINAIQNVEQIAKKMKTAELIIELKIDLHKIIGQTNFYQDHIFDESDYQQDLTI